MTVDKRLNNHRRPPAGIAPHPPSPNPHPPLVTTPLLLLPFIALLLAVAPAAAVDVPPLTGRVVDGAEMLSPRAEAAISQSLAALEQSDSTQVVVLTIPTLEGEDIESFALRVAHDTYHLGQEGKDNGVLLLVVRDDHKMRIEVGYGLEGVVTDLLAGRIVDQVMVPRFRAGDFEGGIAAGVAAIGQAVRGEFKAPTSRRFDRGRRSGDALFGLLMLPALLGRAGVLFGLVGGAIAGPLLVLFAFPPFSIFKAVVAAAACGGLGSVVGGLFGGRRGMVGMGLGYPGAFGGPRIGGGFGGGLGGGGFGGFSGGGGGFGGGGASGGW